MFLVSWGFFFFFFGISDLGLGPRGLRGPIGRVYGAEKNPFIKQSGFGFLGQIRGLGSCIKKPGPNPTHCHS